MKLSENDNHNVNLAIVVFEGVLVPYYAEAWFNVHTGGEVEEP